MYLPTHRRSLDILTEHGGSSVNRLYSPFSQPTTAHPARRMPADAPDAHVKEAADATSPQAAPDDTFPPPSTPQEMASAIIPWVTKKNPLFPPTALAGRCGSAQYNLL
jgi:hypothetical protein